LYLNLYLPASGSIAKNIKYKNTNKPNQNTFNNAGGIICLKFIVYSLKKQKLEMWTNAQRDGRPAEYRWRPLFNAAKFG